MNPWETTNCSPELLLEYIQKCERINGDRPKLRECVEEFGGFWKVIVCLWELEKRGVIKRVEEV